MTTTTSTDSGTNTPAQAAKVLLIGYGNPGRLDDGLGPALAEAIEKKELPGVTVDADYQLVVEDAAIAAEYDVVIFADAAVIGKEPFAFHRIQPQAELSFSSHSCEPGAVLAMAEDLFHGHPRGYALAIRGYTFNEFGQRLSEKARQNLDAAVTFIEGVVTNALFDDAAEAISENTEKEKSN